MAGPLELTLDGLLLAAVAQLFHVKQWPGGSLCVPRSGTVSRETALAVFDIIPQAWGCRKGRVALVSASSRCAYDCVI